MIYKILYYLVLTALGGEIVLLIFSTASATVLQTFSETF